MVALALRAYRAVIERRTGKSSHVGRFGKLNAGTRAAVLACARALVENHVAPLAWVDWSWKVWTRHGEDEKRPPPVKWVFAESRLTEHYEWFRSSDKGGWGERRYTRTGREVLQRWAGYQRDGGYGPRGPEAFAPGEYDALCDQAQREVMVAQADYDRRAAAGEWVWEETATTPKGARVN